MEDGQRGSADQPTSRRAARRSSRPASRLSRLVATGPVARVAALGPRVAAAGPRWAPRAAILAALVTATVVVPLTDGPTATATVLGTSAPMEVDYPSVVEVLASEGEGTPTSVLAGVPGVVRAADTVSRAADREVLPGCTGQAQLDSPNGQIPASDLCTLWDGASMLRGDAAVSLMELNEGFRAVFGRDLCVTDAYRSLAEQRRLAYVKPGLAATPGTSNHGWGLAIDLCTQETNTSAVITWLNDNGPVFGWDNPGWARAGGSGAYEPWHWEYVPGTTAMGTNWDD